MSLAAWTVVQHNLPGSEVHSANNNSSQKPRASSLTWLRVYSLVRYSLRQTAESHCLRHVGQTCMQCYSAHYKCGASFVLLVFEKYGNVVTGSSQHLEDFPKPTCGTQQQCMSDASSMPQSTQVAQHTYTRETTWTNSSSVQVIHSHDAMDINDKATLRSIHHTCEAVRTDLHYVYNQTFHVTYLGSYILQVQPWSHYLHTVQKPRPPGLCNSPIHQVLIA